MHDDRPQTNGSLVTSSELTEDWREWIEEGHAIVMAWERDTREGRVLQLSEAVLLAEAIARGLHRAYVRGQAECTTE